MHSLDDTIYAARLVGECERFFVGEGLKVAVGGDFDAYRSIAENSEKGGASRFFDPSYEDLLPDNAFWVMGRDAETDALVLTIAMRRHDLPRSNLAELWRRQWPRLFGGDGGRAERPCRFDVSSVNGVEQCDC